MQLKDGILESQAPDRGGAQGAHWCEVMLSHLTMVPHSCLFPARWKQFFWRTNLSFKSEYSIGLDHNCRRSRAGPGLCAEGRARATGHCHDTEGVPPAGSCSGALQALVWPLPAAQRSLRDAQVGEPPASSVGLWLSGLARLSLGWSQLPVASCRAIALWWRIQPSAPLRVA